MAPHVNKWSPLDDALKLQVTVIVTTSELSQFTYPYVMIAQPSSCRVKSMMDLYCCWLLFCQLMPRIAIFLLCLPQQFKAMQSTATGAKQQRFWYAANRKRTNGSSVQHYLQYTKINTRKTEVWQSSTHRKCQTQKVNLYKSDKKPNMGGAKQKRCQIAEVPNRRCAKQQRCKIAEVLVCNKPKENQRIQHAAQTAIHKLKINTTSRETEVRQSSTHWKCQTEEVHLYKTDEKPNGRGAKQKRCQIAEAPNRRRAKQQRCKIAEVLVCSQPKEDERIWRAALTTIHKTKINTRKTEVWQSSTHRKCQMEEVHLYKTDEKQNGRRAKQKRFVSTKPTKCQVGDVQNSRGFGLQTQLTKILGVVTWCSSENKKKQFTKKCCQCLHIQSEGFMCKEDAY